MSIMTWYVLALGLINWIATTIICTSELTRELREALTRWAMPLDGSHHPVRLKLRYLSHCQMCCGVWVAAAEVAFMGSPWGGVAGFVSGVLLVKAIGHLVLELRPQSWYIEDEPDPLPWYRHKTYADYFAGSSIRKWIMDELDRQHERNGL